MCYNIAFLTKRLEIYEKRYGASFQSDPPTASFHSSGFSHPMAPVISSNQIDSIQIMQWGLIPHWAKSWNEAQKIWNQTLNARSETVFEKPSFRKAIKNQRCVVLVDAFFEHQQVGKAKVPWKIEDIQGEPLALAGIYDVWHNPESPNQVIQTFSIITGRSSVWMSYIHNTPTDPRMPVILLPEEVKPWLSGEDKQSIQSFFKPFAEDGLKAHTIGKLSGKEYVGNIPEIWDKVSYLEVPDTH